MIVGVPKEIKEHEYRVALLPVAVDLLTNAGHKVLIEKDAGIGSGYTNEMYVEAGAELVDGPTDVFGAADMVVKVKEPQKSEFPLMRKGQTLFTYFHFAAEKALTEACLTAGITAVAYETLEDSRGRLPLLTPMSEVAGRLSIQEGAKCLERPMQGRGILLGGVTGVERGNVMILGGGVVGSNAAIMAAGIGANVTVMDINLDRLRYLDEVMPANVQTRYSHPHAIRELLPEADLVVGALLITGARTPVLITREDLKLMKPGSVMVDVSVDQGGCVETTRPTSHAEPTYVVEDVLHYCVSNMPGAVGRTSTQALCHATQPFVLKIASEGIDKLADTHAFRTAINMRNGTLLNKAVGEAHDLSVA